MLVRERMLYKSGLLPICVQAAAAVIPELIPVPSVPSPVHNPAAKNIIPSMVFSVAEWGTASNNVTAINKQKITGVSIIA